MKNKIWIILFVMLILVTNVLADIGETGDNVIFTDELFSFQAITFGAQTCSGRSGSCYTKVDGSSYTLINCVQGIMSDGRAKCTCDYGLSCGASSSCALQSVRCNGNMRQLCVSSLDGITYFPAKWLDTGICPSGLTCVQTGITSLECKGTLIAECSDNVYNCLGQKQRYCKNGQWVDLGVTCPDTTVCQGGGYNERPVCKNKDYLTNECSYDFQCGSGRECIDTNLGRRCITCTYDGACDPYCDADPDCAELPIITPLPVAPAPGTTLPDPTAITGVFGIPYWVIPIIAVLIMLIVWWWKKK